MVNVVATLPDGAHALGFPIVTFEGEIADALQDPSHEKTKGAFGPGLTITQFNREITIAGVQTTHLDRLLKILTDKRWSVIQIQS